MLGAIYGPICKCAKNLFGEKEFECIKCKDTFKEKISTFWLPYAFLVKMTASNLDIKSFLWHQEPKWPL